MGEAEKPAIKNTGNIFKPGVSGNPSGRPKINKRIRDLARAHTEEAMEALIAALAATKTVGWGEHMTEVVDHAVRLQAANAILDRGWGKPDASSVGDDEPAADLVAMDDEQLLKLALGQN